MRGGRERCPIREEETRVSCKRGGRGRCPIREGEDKVVL